MNEKPFSFMSDPSGFRVNMGIRVTVSRVEKEVNLSVSVRLKFISNSGLLIKFIIPKSLENSKYFFYTIQDRSDPMSLRGV